MVTNKVQCIENKHKYEINIKFHCTKLNKPIMIKKF